MSAKVRPLRDFFIILFFIILGTHISFDNLGSMAVPIIVLSLFVLVGNALIVMGIMGLMRYTKKPSFMTGIALAQISEFSFIMIALGVEVGHLSREIISFVTFIGLITIAGSTYMIMYSNQLYKLFSPYLNIFQRKSRLREMVHHTGRKYDIILFGYNRIGYGLVHSFKKIKNKFLIIDFNPETVINLAHEGYECRYGDAGDEDLLKEIDLSHPKMIISTIPSLETNLLLLSKIHGKNNKVVTIVVSYQIDEATRLYEAGATYVLMPHFLGGEYASTMMEKYGFNIERFLAERVKHLEHLHRRKQEGHEHPKSEQHR
jgi:Trk K+ transport system NAD-binding subunit